MSQCRRSQLGCRCAIWQKVAHAPRLAARCARAVVEQLKCVVRFQYFSVHSSRAVDSILMLRLRITSGGVPGNFTSNCPTRSRTALAAQVSSIETAVLKLCLVAPRCYRCPPAEFLNIIGWKTFRNQGVMRCAQAVRFVDSQQHPPSAAVVGSAADI